jgi:hypothetical protein
VRMPPDDHFHRWPAFTSRIVHAYNTAPHESLNGDGVAPCEICHGAAARDPFDSVIHALALDAAELPNDDLDDPTGFANAARTSAAAFTRLAKCHDDHVRQTSTARLNAHGHPKMHAAGDKVKIRMPPTRAGGSNRPPPQPRRRLERPLHNRHPPLCLCTFDERRRCDGGGSRALSAHSGPAGLDPPLSDLVVFQAALS